MGARIRHIAIKTANPERLAAFYEKAFEMEITHRTPIGTVFLTDGYINLALIPCRVVGNAAPGINHFGFQVDHAEAAAEKVATLGVPMPAARPDTTPYAELRGIDPDGNMFDISEHGYGDIEFPPERRSRQPAKKKETA